MDREVVRPETDGGGGKPARRRTLRLRRPFRDLRSRSDNWGFRAFRVVLVTSMILLGVWSVFLLAEGPPLHHEIESETKRLAALEALGEELLDVGFRVARDPSSAPDPEAFDGWLVKRGDDLRRLGVPPEEHLRVRNGVSALRDEIRTLSIALSEERRDAHAYLEELERKSASLWTWLTLLIGVLFLQAITALVLLDWNVRAQRRISVLFQRATRDELTGVLNRRAIIESADRELERAAREGKDLALMLVDLDWFKQVNDRLGHRAGDDLLREVSLRFERSLRPYDSVGRYGGDEFLIVLPGCDVEAASQVAERICEAMRKPAQVGVQRWAGSVSIGVATAIRGGAVLSELMDSADAALYRTKAKGRDGWTATSHLPNVGVPAPGDALDAPAPAPKSSTPESVRP